MLKRSEEGHFSRVESLSGEYSGLMQSNLPRMSVMRRVKQGLGFAINEETVRGG